MPRGRRKGPKGQGPPASSTSSSSTPQKPDDDDVDFDPDKLSIVVEGQSNSFNEWTLEYAHHYYPEAGQRTYRVPPVDFNTQVLTDDIQLGYAQLAAPKDENRKKDRSQADVSRRLEELGKQLQERTGRGLFIVSSAHYDNYLSDLKNLRTRGSKLPPLPKEVAQRGELDVLVLHPVQGIVLVQVKGVALPDSWKPTQTQLQDAVSSKVAEAQRQLIRDVEVLQHVLADLHLTCDLHRVVALPFVSISLLRASVPGAGMEGVVYLCAEHVSSKEAMLTWWKTHIVREGSTPLADCQLKSIVGRYCGLLSTVSVWCKSALRVEVRDVAEAVQEVGDRFANIVLTAQQRQALDSQDPFIFLHGPPGTGKSVLMVVKARQWLLQGRDVLVFNVDFGRQGNPVGHYIHDSITQWLLMTSRDEPASPGPGRSSSVGGAKSSSADGQRKRSRGGKKKVAGGTEKLSAGSDSVVPGSPDEQSPTVHKGSDSSMTTGPPENTTESKAESDFPMTVSTEHQESEISEMKAERDSSMTVCSAPQESETLKKKAERDSPTTASPVPPESTRLDRKDSDTGVGSSETDSSLATLSSCSASLSSSSDAESGLRRQLGQVFRVDFDLGMNLDDRQAHDKVQQLLQQVEKTLRPGVPCCFLMDEFYWKDRLLPMVEELRRRFPHSAVWCAEVSGDTFPPGFKPVFLTTVLRCPPSVQAMLKKVDWTQNHKDLYHEDSTLQGLPTDGFRPTLLEHRHHPAQSPLDCIHCADLLITFFREELKLEFGPDLRPSSLDGPSAGPDLSPGTSPPPGPCSGTASSLAEDSSDTKQHPEQLSEKKTLPVPKGKKKRTRCLPRRVKFSDIVVLFSYPQQCISRPSKEGLLLVEDKPQDIHHDNIQNSVFLGRMKEAGLPVVFRAPNSDAREIALPTEDRVLFSVTNAVTGLERKVVVYVPCESTSYQYPVVRRRPPYTPPHTTSVSSSTAPASQAARSDSGDSEEQRIHRNPDLQSTKPGEEMTAVVSQDADSGRQQEQSLVLRQYECEAKSSETSGWMFSEQTSDSLHPVQMQVVPDDRGGPGCSGDNHPAENPHRSTEEEAARLDVTEGNRDDGCQSLPTPHGIQSTTDLTGHRLGTSKPGSESDSASEMAASETPADAKGVSRVATIPVTAGLSQEDWAKIHDRLLEQNLKGLFYGASRCLSVFVLIIP